MTLGTEPELSSPKTSPAIGAETDDEHPKPRNASVSVRNMLARRGGPLGVLRLPQEALLGIFVAALMVFIALSVPNFLTADNAQNVARQAAVLTIVAVGQLFVIVIGGLDISVGAQVSLLAILAITLSLKVGVPLAFMVTVVAGAFIGLINGVVIAYLRVSPVIATLGSWQAMFGIALWWTKGVPVRNNSADYAALGSGQLGFIATPTLLAIVVAIAAWIVLKYSRLGRYFYAIGGNAEASHLVGIDVKQVTVWAYVLCSICAAIGAITLSSRTESGDPLIGSSLNLENVAAVFIGGAAWAGGSGSVIGVVLGVILLRVLENAFNLNGISTDLQTMITGVLIVVAVAGYGLKRRTRRA